MQYIFKPEFELTSSERSQIRGLLNQSFPGFFKDRIYYKQLAHFRLLAYEENSLIGQLGVDHRVITLEGKPLTIFGVIDLCVAKEKRGQRIAQKLLSECEQIATTNKIDCLLLFADDHSLYKKMGFLNVRNECHWLGIDEHKTVGLLTNSLDDCMLIKTLSDFKWTDGPVDLLGYLF